ncbi:TPA: hypothetical protein NJ203_004201 [Vibrio parahaemolyticus]|nr:hypothetical protein [Vibrio alginolyticus]HCG6378944.1 hypothetical protein [Vibrio parahaemolyticus]
MDSKLSVEPPKAKSDREANSYISLLIKKRALHRYHTKNFIDLDIEKKNALVRKAFKGLEKNDTKILKDELIKEYNENNLLEKIRCNFDKKDSRKINWLWGFIIYNRRDIERNYLEGSKTDTSVFEILAVDKESKYNQVINYIDKLNILPHNSIYFYNDLIKEWNFISKDNSLKKFLERDQERLNEKSIELIKFMDKNLGLYPEIRIFQDIENTAPYETCLAVYDLINDEIIKENLLLKFSKSWSQYKYRTKNSGKKQYTFILPPDAKKKLDRIVDLSDKNIGDTLTDIIEKAYRELS